MNESRLTYLFQAYFNKTATIKERDELMALISLGEKDEELMGLLTETWEKFSTENQLFSEARGEEMLSGILEEGKRNSGTPVIGMSRSLLGWLRIAAAAAIFIFSVAATYYWINNQPPAQQSMLSDESSHLHRSTVVPGGNRAVLTLSDGSEIVLDSTQEGALTRQGNTKVVKLKTPTLAYNAGITDTQAIIYNTLSTPGGGNYQLILPDGTKVWLNASSSIHFPTYFKGKERYVTVTGEVYFEVAKNATMPFKINAKGVVVEVLGTHLNIMAYDDESSVNTTLLEGSVKVSQGTSEKVLVPGQESRVGKTGDMEVVQAEMEEVMAWKNGWFEFNTADIEKVMRQIARWYDVEVIYEGKMPTGHFSGLVSRQNDISEVLKIMEAGGVRFRIEGRKVFVLS
ncbi:FecR domain-containing protein [Chitinophaga sp. MM2321]|uniref:FecR family protein n=1 Tax=Chitinophaga sp. MM2321 TaxID=3137178 RepID=UPI0032D56904